MYRETFTGINNPDCMLQQVQIQVDIHETLSMVSTMHSYINHGTVNIEVVYTFPLPNGAVLLDMNLVIGDRTLTGQIIPKKQAEDRYEDAVVEGDLPAMLQNPSPGIYTLNIANIQPGERVAISFTYGLLLTWQDHDLRFTLHTTIAPRYGYPNKAELDEHQMPKTDFLAENQYSLTVVVHGRMASASITSPSHEIHIRPLDDTTQILLARSYAFMDRDFVLTISAPDMNHSALTWDQDDGRYLLWASFHPYLDMKCDDVGRGVVLVVDCSGSMAGDSIDQAKNASKCILESLRPQDYFNIVAFGSGHRKLFRRMKPVDRDNLDDAVDFVTSLQADMGGTELENALSSALEFSCKHISTLDIILITDGEVWNIDETVQIAVKGSRRIFSIGVGSSPAESLLKTLSAKTGGACEFVFPGESMTEKILRHVRRIYSPKINRIETNWPVCPEKTFPDKLQGVFDGDTVHVFGWFGGCPESGNVGLSLTLSNEQLMQISAGDVSTASTCKTPGLIARMTAALQLEDMLDADAATELAVHYQLLSRYTHCLAVAVQTEAEKAQTLPEIHQITQMLAAGWGGSGRIQPDISFDHFMSFDELSLDEIVLDDLQCDHSDSSVTFDSLKLMDLECELEKEENDSLDFDEVREKLSIDDKLSIQRFAEYLNQYDINSDTDLSSIFEHLPPVIQRAYITSSRKISPTDDFLTVFLYLFLQSDYGKDLNRKVCRIIKKRFKHANLAKDLVKRVSDKIEPILRQSQLF